MTKLDALAQIGQAVWLDDIHRSLITSGQLQTLVNQGLRGMTSNPTIFDKAITQSHDYDAQLRELLAARKSPEQIYQALVVKDIQDAADIFRPVFDRTQGADGFVSLEANPRLAHDTQGTMREIRQLRSLVNRPNVMYKIPATAEGMPAIEQLTGEGFNINITLMFSMEHYEQVVNAYLSGLEKLQAAGGDLARVASVASFFVSRVDTKVDPQLAALGHPELQGTAAIANAKNVYARFNEIFHSERWRRLAAHGARVQRPLWASTSTKNPALPDTLYVDSLIGPDTVNTLPMNTIDAFLDHGTVASTVEHDLDQTRARLKQLRDLGIDLHEVGETLLREGIDQFVQKLDDLLNAINAQRERIALH